MQLPAHLVDVPKIDELEYQERNILAKHNLNDLDLFNDDSLAKIIDAHPRSEMTIAIMNQDPESGEWWQGSANDLTGEQILVAVKKGQFWLNLQRIYEHNPEFRKITDQLYDELQDNSPGLQLTDRNSHLLISSPQAVVHYHIDHPGNMLWHIRGTKRVWVYPFDDRELIPRELFHSLLMGQRKEEFPFSKSFDDKAQVYDMEPGDFVSWPQNSPHRVENTSELNVSLSTEHASKQTERRERILRVNKFIYDVTGVDFAKTPTEGMGYYLRLPVIILVRLTYKLFPQQKPTNDFKYPIEFHIDPDSADGVKMITE